MSDNSKIEWCDATWNPVAGCSPTSPGCANCYAGGMARRLEAMGQTKYAGTAERRGKVDVFTGRINFDETALDAPLRWKKPRRIFVNSMSDLFHEGVSDSFIDRVFAVMALCPQHTFQVLTKRADRMARYMNAAGYRNRIETTAAELWPEPHTREFVNEHIERHSGLIPNVWLGVSVEDQQRADERIPFLLNAPAAVRFLSCEPLLGPIDLECFGPRGPTQAWASSLPETWAAFSWPDWVPADQRKQIEDFWSESYGRSPRAWGADHLVQHVPATGARLTCTVEENRWVHVSAMATEGVTGRYLHSWNNIGWLITDEAEVYPAYGGIGSGWLNRWLTPDGDYRHKLNLVIVGGESGHHARPMHPDWPRGLRDQCVARGVPFFFKQWGEWSPICAKRSPCRVVFSDGRSCEFTREAMIAEERRSGIDHNRCHPMSTYRTGKRLAGRLLDDRTWDQLPQASAPEAVR